jgi:uncharacterized 2Fe-2S/4Fe-4S cluster protein (DUF4445 family)
MGDSSKAKVIFQPSGRRGEVDRGITIIEASRRLGVDIETLCGGQRVCGKCKVLIETGSFEKFGIRSDPSHVSAWQHEEEQFITPDERALGFRLGCAARIQGDILVFIPEESRAGKQVVSKAARTIQINWNPAVKLYTVAVTPPTLEDPLGDFERMTHALGMKYGLNGLDIDWFTLRDLPNAIRKGEWTITAAVWMDREIIKLWPGKVEDYYGLAIDVGTTTVAAYLCNMRTMEVLDTVSMMNPQCKYGEDVMSRITYHMKTPGGLERMSDDIIEGLNDLVQKACDATHPPKKKQKDENGKSIRDENGEFVIVESPEEGKPYPRLQPSDIVDLTLGGNTAMHHILLKLDPQYVGLGPFPPVIHRSLDIRVRDLGIHINRSSRVFVMPNEAGFVGADNVCVLVCEKPHQSDALQLIIDIGTNGELVLGNKDKLISSSCATGPALEGAQLTFGMRAAPGAIERIKIDPETHDVDYKVIGREAWLKYSKPEEMKTKGICGSGILDVLAELYRSGVVEKSGRFSKNQKSDRFRKNPDNPRQKEFVIAWANETSIGKDVVITQKDIRQIQLAKGALYTGCKLMMRRMGVEHVDTIKIAGAFGTHVDREKALIMGLFPDCDVEKILSVGNAAGDGARVVLLDRSMRKDANWISRHVEYIELSLEPGFEKAFVESMQIPHMTDQFPHLEGLVPEDILHQE